MGQSKKVCQSSQINLRSEKQPKIYHFFGWIACRRVVGENTKTELRLKIQGLSLTSREEASELILGSLQRAKCPE